MKIENLRTVHLRNDEHFQFHTEFRDLVTSCGAAALKIKPMFDTYLPLYDTEDEALKKIVKSEFTAKIHEADKARDEIWVGIEETVATAHRHFNPTVRDAAARLQIVLDTYGNVAKKSLDEETSAVYNILQELQGKYTTDVETVGIAYWVAELKARNDALEVLVKERDSEEASKTHVVMKEARKAVDMAYKQMCETMNAYMVLGDTATYGTFAGVLNEVIGRYKRKRHHHHHGLNQNSQNLQNGQNI